MLSSSLPPQNSIIIDANTTTNIAAANQTTPCNCSKPLQCPMELFERAIYKVFIISPKLESMTPRDLASLLKSLLQVYTINPGLADGQRRLATFASWNQPINGGGGGGGGAPSVESICNQLGGNSARLPPARDAAQSGFFHTGCDDETVCISCGIGLKGWQPGDFVDAQHANFAATLYLQQQQHQQQQQQEQQQQRANPSRPALPRHHRSSSKCVAESPCNFLVAKAVLSAKTALVVKEAASPALLPTGAAREDAYDWKWLDDLWRFVDVEAHKLSAAKQTTAGRQRGVGGVSGELQRRRCITDEIDAQQQQDDEATENDDGGEECEPAIDIIRNVRGLGHSVAMVTLAAFYHYTTAGGGGGRSARTPRSTVELLRAVLQVEEALEAAALTEADLPRFDKFVRYVAELRPTRMHTRISSARHAATATQNEW